MFETASETTPLLAKLIGAYCCAAGIGGLRAPDTYRMMVEELRASKALSFLTGVLVLLLGGAITGVHSSFSDPLAAIVSLVGFAALLKGLMFLAVPGVFLSFSLSLLRPSLGRLYATIALLLGIALLAAGFFATVG